MERKTASRKLKRKCFKCDCKFKKGDVYYRQREIMRDGVSEIIAVEYLVCPKCKHEKDSHLKRLEEFKPKCHHPIVDEVWSYIPGEAVMQPDHEECLVCGEWL